MQAIIIGATGATGSDLLHILLNDQRYSAVKIFVRKPTGIQHPKLAEEIIDFERPEQWKAKVTGDVLFSCLGTTLKDAGSEEAQYKVDFGYQFAFAQAAKENGVSTLALISSASADARSRFFYMKMKGELEEAVRDLKFAKTVIFRPPMLIRKETDRGSEKIGLQVVSFLNKFGIFRSQKPMKTEHLAQTMAEKAISESNGVHIFEGPELKEV